MILTALNYWSDFFVHLYTVPKAPNDILEISEDLTFSQLALSSIEIDELPLLESSEDYSRFKFDALILLEQLLLILLLMKLIFQ